MACMGLYQVLQDLTLPQWKGPFSQLWKLPKIPMLNQNTLTRFWLFLTTYPPASIFYSVWTLTKSGHFKTTYLPYHVNVACERPLSMIYVLIKVRKFQNQIVLFSFSPKNQQFVSALWVQNGSNKKRHNIILNWGLFNMINCLYFFGLTHFRLLGQKLLGGALNKSKYQLFDGLG